jgi:hypothetical protein
MFGKIGRIDLRVRTWSPGSDKAAVEKEEELASSG